VDFVDEEHIARLQIGQDGREIAGLLDDGAGGRAETDAELARHDLRHRGLAEAGRPVQQDMIQRFAARPRGFDENGEVLAAAFLADEIRKGLRTQAGLAGILAATRGGDGTVLDLLGDLRVVRLSAARAGGHERHPALSTSSADLFRGSTLPGAHTPSGHRRG
jgi:hypothetical protein